MIWFPVICKFSFILFDNFDLGPCKNARTWTDSLDQKCIFIEIIDETRDWKREKKVYYSCDKMKNPHFRSGSIEIVDIYFFRMLFIAFCWWYILHSMTEIVWYWRHCFFFVCRQCVSLCSVAVWPSFFPVVIFVVVAILYILIWQ